MKKFNGRKLEIVKWEDVCRDVASINNELAAIIDSIPSKNDLHLIKATYLYGDLIVNNGFTYLPDKNNKLQLINNSDLPVKIKESLSYQFIPLFLTLRNDNEVFVDTGKRVVPLNLFHQGSLLGVFEAADFMLDRKISPRWCVSAGARSILMLPKITDNLGLDRLRLHYNIPATLRVKYLQDHWELFVAMANNPDFVQPWQNEVLFFPKDWLLKKSSQWNNFREYLYRQAWQQAQFSIGRIEDSLQWEMFAEAISLRNLKPRPYLADQVKHILAIAAGKSPAFKPTNDEHTAPIQEIQKSIANIYLLKNHMPTIMSIDPLNDFNKPIPVYYSLSFPTVMEGTPVDKSTSTVMLDLRKIKLLMDTLKRYVEKNPSFGNSVIHDIGLTYFHVEADKYGEIEISSKIPERDLTFATVDREIFPDRRFCDTSQFWRGCIMLHHRHIKTNK